MDNVICVLVGLLVGFFGGWICGDSNGWVRRGEAEAAKRRHLNKITGPRPFTRGSLYDR